MIAHKAWLRGWPGVQCIMKTVVVALLLVALVTGCSPTNRKGLIAAGYAPEYVDGYVDGYSAGWRVPA